VTTLRATYSVVADIRGYRERGLRLGPLTP
jgi:hypothetical protein